MKSRLVALILATGITASVHAATITVTNVGSDAPHTNGISDSTGTLLNNTFVALGYFTGLTDADLMAMSPSTFSAIIGSTAFAQLGSQITWVAPGAYQGVAGAATPALSPFVGKSAYTLIGNAATLSASTELLIAKHSFTIPEDPNTSADAILDLSGGGGNGTILWGNTGSFSFDFGSGAQPSYSTLSAASAAPEPSRIIFAASGLFGCLLRRRRN
ncbi:MAG: hypothetical protein IPK32_07965 [Verrucomicrobiaceae bacterium]|nr:hypothetical protein [Verrucomicrobiaceae bacterium]